MLGNSLLALLALGIGISVAAEPGIIYKYVDDFTEVWNDAGSGADEDVSYWHPKATSYEYSALGDVASNSHSKPATSAMLVKELIPGALAKPTGFDEIWADHGSDADADVRIMSMLCPEGYLSMGNAVVASYSSLPDLNEYRCVRSDFVTEGALTQIWNDGGSGADNDVSNWRVIRGADTNTQETGCFISVASHNKPTPSVWLLKDDKIENYLHTNINIDNDAKLKLYKMSDMELIWKDTGSGADKDFSCWRVKGPSNTYSLGDIPQANYDKPSYGLVAKAIDEQALKAPYDYRRRWYDAGSDADWDGAFWEPLCPSGYVPLGHLCSKNYNKPDSNQFRCVRTDLVSNGQWNFVWNDAGSEADQDAAVYQAVATQGNQQGVDAMGAVQSHGQMDVTAYVLQGEKTSMIDGKPAKKYIMTNVQYNLDDRKLVNQKLANLARLVVENRGDTTQTSERTLTAEWSETSSWSFTSGLELSVEMETSAGVPLIGESTVTVGVKTSFEFASGGEVTTTNSDSVTAKVVVKPHHQKSVLMVGTNYKADIPFTADIKTEYDDGTTAFRSAVKGTYTGVTVADRRVIYENDIPL